MFLFREDLHAIIDDINFSIDLIKNEAKVLSTSKVKEEIFIPHSIKYKSKEYKIKFISKNAFEKTKIKSLWFAEDSFITVIPSKIFSYTLIQELHLPSSIQELKEGWCSQTPNLTNITVSSNNKIFQIYENQFLIGKSDEKDENYDILYFARRNIEGVINIPSTIKIINSFSFEYCKSLEKVKFSKDSKLNKIKKYAFSNSTIKSIKIPKNVSIIEDYSFFKCINLENVHFEDESEIYSIGSYAFSLTAISSISIPKKVKSIKTDTFFKCINLTNVYFSNDSMLEIIKDGAFKDLNLKSIKIPKNVSIIEDYAFYECNDLESVEFDNESELHTIGCFVFYNTSISTISIPYKVGEINLETFAKCKHLKSVNFSNKSQLKKIELGAFKESNIESILIPKNVSFIEKSAFSECINLRSIKFENDSKLNSIEESLFFTASISEISIPDSVKKIGKKAFSYCKNLRCIIFSDKSKLNRIEAKAFFNSNIEEINLSSNLCYLSNEWCLNTPNLKKIKISSNNKKFKMIGDKILVGKSKANIENYDSIYFASRDIETIIIPSTVNHILSCSFQDCKNIKKFEIENEIELYSIGRYSFQNSSISSISIPKNIKEIEDNAFCDCKKLNKVEFSIDSQLTKIGCKAFSNTIIKSIKIPKKVSIIDKEAFSYCKNLEKIEFEEKSNLKTINSEAFLYTNIEEIYLPKNVEVLDLDWCSCMPKLKKVKTSIDSKNFLNIGGRILIGKSSKKVNYANTNDTKFNEIVDYEIKMTGLNEYAIQFSDDVNDNDIPYSNIPLKCQDDINISCIYNNNNSIPLIFKDNDIKNQYYDVPCKYDDNFPYDFKNENKCILIDDGFLYEKDDDYDQICFVSSELNTIYIPSKFKENELLLKRSDLNINTINNDDFYFKIFMHDLPEKYKIKINNKIIQKVYSKFTFKFYQFNDKDDSKFKRNIMHNLAFYLLNFKFITFYLVNINSKNKTNCIFCVEDECIIIECINISDINNLIKELKHFQISLINLSKNTIVSLEKNEDAIEEMNNFCNHFTKEIKNNYFVKYTIYPIVCYLIRRYFYPSYYFVDKSFFIFNQQQINNSNHINCIQKIKYYLDLNPDNEYENSEKQLKSLKNIINDCKSFNNYENKFQENDFIELKLIYSNNIWTYYLVIHLQSLYIFMMKKTVHCNSNKEIKNEINFCKYSHRCILPFYGFIIYKEKKIGLIYEYMSNGNLSSFIENNQINDIFLITTIGRIFQGIDFLHSNKLIHRDLKPCNIMINHDNLAFISDLETIRSVNGKDGDFTGDIGSPLYSSPEQDNGEKISYSTDIYSFGLIIYYLYEKKHMLKYGNEKYQKIIRPMKHGPLIIRDLYEKCVQMYPFFRITNDKIKTILNEEFNSFLYFENFLLNSSKNEINIEQIINFILEKILFQQQNSLIICYDQIKYFKILFSLIMDNNKSNFFLLLGDIYKKGECVKQNYLLANEFYEKSSKFQNSKAFLLLGDLYLNGFGVEFNYLKAIECYKKSNNSYAYLKLGKMYENGYFVEQDYCKAEEYYIKSSKLQNPEAFFLLGSIYECVKKDIYKAFEYYEKSAELNDSNALCIMGSFYITGKGVKKSYSKAFDYFKKSSELGNSDAYLIIGYCYEIGLFVKQDYFKAKENYKKSLELNNSRAFLYLGKLYEKGLGVDKEDYLFARYYYEKSSELNNSDAFLSLGQLYEKGLGVKQNYLLAKEFYEKSSELNNSDAFLLLGQLYEKGLGVKQNYLLAKEYYEKSSLFNNAAAFNCLGNLYDKGLGVKQNYLFAKNCYQISSNHNNPFAHFYLGNFYSYNELDEIDIEKSIEYYLKSIQIPNGSYNEIDDNISIKRFSENNHRYVSYNNLGLIFITNSKYFDKNKAKEYLKESNYAEYPLGINNFGLFNQIYLNNINKAEDRYIKILSKYNFSLAYYNLGKIKENKNKIEESIQLYIKASKYENEPLFYRNFEYYDKRFEISKKFIVCLTNLKIISYYFSMKNYDESKEYFIRLFSSLYTKDKNSVYKFYFRMKSKDEPVDEYLNNFFVYLKIFILDYPLFNLRNQPNIDSNIFKDIENQKEYDMNIDKYDSEESDDEENNKININNKTLNKFSMSPNKKSPNDPNENKVQKKLFFKDPGDFFDFLIESSNLYSNFRKIIDKINEIIKIMNSILDRPPYLILFGRISFQKPKSVENKDIKEINQDFYDGFYID